MQGFHGPWAKDINSTRYGQGWATASAARMQEDGVWLWWAMSRLMLPRHLPCRHLGQGTVRELVDGKVLTFVASKSHRPFLRCLFFQVRAAWCEQHGMVRLCSGERVVAAPIIQCCACQSAEPHEDCLFVKVCFVTVINGAWHAAFTCCLFVHRPRLSCRMHWHMGA